MSILKKKPDSLVKLVFVDSNDFVSAFLDGAGILKKPNYKKQLAESAKQLAEAKKRQVLGK